MRARRVDSPDRDFRGPSPISGRYNCGETPTSTVRSRMISVSLEDIFPFLFLAGLGLGVVGWLALVVVAFRVGWRWGLGVLLFPPAAVVFLVRHTKKALIPIGILLVGGSLVAGPPLYVRLIPI